jgi:hypothetical protein
MAYRRSRVEAPGSSRWRAAHRRSLLDAGLPADVVDSDRALTYVLLHGDDALGSGWDPSWLTDEQASRLLTLLQQLLGDSVAYEILPRLSARAARRSG